MKIVNKTPHVLTLLSLTTLVRTRQGLALPEGTSVEDATLLSLPPEAPEARAAQAPDVAGEEIRVVVGSAVVAVPTVAPITYGAPENLPAPEEGVFLAVSSITALAARAAGRPTHDLLIPASVVRDAGGKPVGCTAFARV